MSRFIRIFRERFRRGGRISGKYSNALSRKVRQLFSARKNQTNSLSKDSRGPLYSLKLLLAYSPLWSFFFFIRSVFFPSFFFFACYSWVQVETVPIPRSCALDIIISSFCKLSLCCVSKFSLCVDWYLSEPQGFFFALNQDAIWM